MVDVPSDLEWRLEEWAMRHEVGDRSNVPNMVRDLRLASSIIGECRRVLRLTYNSGEPMPDYLVVPIGEILARLEGDSHATSSGLPPDHAAVPDPAPQQS